MATRKRPSNERPPSRPQPLETISTSMSMTAVASTVRPFAASFEDLPRLRDAQPGVRPFELRFEDLPRVRDTVTGVRPLESIEAGTAAFGGPQQIE